MMETPQGDSMFLSHTLQAGLKPIEDMLTRTFYFVQNSADISNVTLKTAKINHYLIQYRST